MFYKDKIKKDGLGSYCKKCRDAASKKYKKDHPGRIRKYMKEYVHEYRKNDKVKEREKFYSTNYRARNKEKYRAMDILRNAIRAGRVIKPDRCQLRGKVCIVHGHHEDYSLPLAVLWLCTLCHKKRHKEMERALSEPLVDCSPI